MSPSHCWRPHRVLLGRILSSDTKLQSPGVAVAFCGQTAVLELSRQREAGRAISVYEEKGSFGVIFVGGNSLFHSSPPALKSSPSKKGRSALLAVKTSGPTAAFSASQLPSEKDETQYDLRAARSYPTLDDEGNGRLVSDGCVVALYFLAVLPFLAELLVLHQTHALLVG